MATSTEKKKKGGILSHPAVVAGAVGLPAAAAFMIARRPSRALSGQRAEIAKRIRERGLGVAGEAPKGILGKVKAYFQRGTTQVGEVAELEKKRLGAIYAPDPRKIPQGKTPVLGPGKERSASAWDKLEEARIFQKHAPGAMPTSVPLSEITKARRLEDVQAAAKKRFPGGYVIKGRRESQSGGQILTEKEDLKRTYTEFVKMKRKPMKTKGGKTVTEEELQKTRLTQPASYAQTAADIPGYVTGKKIETVARRPEDVFVQEKLKLKPRGLLDRLSHRLVGSPTAPTAGREVRVHALGSEVLPASVSRSGPVSQFVTGLGFKTRDVAEAEKFVGETLRKMPEGWKKNKAFSFDVGMTEKGPRVIEANPAGMSGFLTPETGAGTAPIAHRFVSALQGRATVPIAATKAVAAGGVGLAGLAGAKAVAKTTEPKPAARPKVDERVQAAAENAKKKMRAAS